MTATTVEESRLTRPDGVELAVTFRPSDGDSVVVLSHGFLSDRHAGGRFDRLAVEYAALGHAVLRYDFSGFGQSGGDVVDGDHLLTDLRTVLDHLDGLGYTRQVLHGQSLGSAVSLRVAPERPAVRTLVLTGALTGAGSGDAPYPFFTPDQVAAWYRDEDVHLDGTGRTVTVNRRRPKVNATGTQEELLTALRVPVLVVHGDTGASERALRAITEAGRHWLPEGSAIEVVEGSEHTFVDHQDEVAALATSWVRRHVPVA
jgi:pimeloyl-ACP methyl ester carboxylesterase